MTTISDIDPVPAQTGDRPRLGWIEIVVGLVTFLLLTLASGIALYALSGTGTGAESLPIVPALALSGLAAIGGVVAAVAVRVRSAAAVGLRRTSRGWVLLGLAAGVLVWLLNRFVVLGYMFLTGDFGNPQQAMADTAAPGGLSLVLILLAGAVLVPFAEELLFRGVVYGALRRYRVLVATVASALLFGLAHGVNAVLPAAIILGVVAAVLYERSRSIWPAVIAHAVNNGIVLVSAAILL